MLRTGRSRVHALLLRRLARADQSGSRAHSHRAAPVRSVATRAATAPHISRATADDVAALAPLFEAYRAFYRCKPDAEGAAAFLKERLTRNESVIFLARVEPKGPPAGFTQLYPLFSSLQLCRSWLLNDLYVIPEARRSGVAAALIARAEELARETGAGLLELSTHQSNRTAQRVYSAAGWSRDDDYYHYHREIPRKS